MFRHILSKPKSFYNKLLAIIFAFNLADAFITKFFIGLGGRELNPAMNWLISQGWVYFFSFKIFLSFFCCAIFYRLFEKSKHARHAILFSAATYSLLMVWHLIVGLIFIFQ